MRPIESLRPQIRGLDGRDYGAYQALKGSYRLGGYRLDLAHIPKDPYAPPGTGAFRLSLARQDAALPDAFFASHLRRVALADFLARRFHEACERLCPGRRGTGNSGLITLAKPEQEILERTSMIVDEEGIEARFFIGLPASGRRIQARLAQQMLLDELPRIADSSLRASSIDLHALERHAQTLEDAEHLRALLPELGLVAFVADGACLPRASGVDPGPLKTGSVVPFKIPESLRVEVELPHAGVVTGMGIREGVTLIVGGGYHGKSTLLEALELGIYNHVPGDGREQCVALPTTVKVRAASGRSVTGADISAFINNLPFGQDTTSFSTANASGSTSQAAFIVESLEAGARVLLLDEDTCAANFMIRDGRMQQLVAREQEPITAFIDCARALRTDLGVSTIIVMGGSGDYFGVADTVIQMAAFEPRDVTDRARAIARASASQRIAEGTDRFPRPRSRAPLGTALDPRNQYGHFRIAAPSPRKLVFGALEIDLSDIEQLTETAQTRAIGRALLHAAQYLDGNTRLRNTIEQVMGDIAREGLDLLDSRRTGDLAAFRGLDLAAALNRVRGLTVRQPS